MAAVGLLASAGLAAQAAPQTAICGPCRIAAGPHWIENTRALRTASNTPGDFDFYVLSLSWSPGFCETPAAASAHGQCETGANLGFVVHGLWPQYSRGYPSDCGRAARSPSRIALESARGLYPSEGLARHEWAKHGTCSGKSPTDYFADVRRARDAVAIPVPFVAAKEQQTWASVDILSAFIVANARLRPGMLGLECNKGVLQEVRVCFSKDLRDFRACPEISQQGCRRRCFQAHCSHLHIVASLRKTELSCPETGKTAEWHGGIGKLLETKPTGEVEAAVAPYLRIAAPLAGLRLPRYAGSPALAQALLRRQDKMLFCEAQEALGKSRRRFASEVYGDGWVYGAAAFVPPVERRGLALIDPPYEEVGELERAAEAVAGA
jgi:ribonuclease T2